MGRRVLAFFLGMIFGIIFLIGGLGLGVYLAVTTLKPSDITADASDYIGDFADMSIMDMVNSVQALYLEKAGVTHGGKYYSLGEFLENYNIDTEKAFGIALPQSLLDIPLFEYFQNGGVDRALSQISLASIPDLLNLFVTNEDGSTYVNDETVEKLSHYSIKDLIDEDKGISYVFADIRFVDILPDAFPEESSGNVLMWAVGQSSIGKLFRALSSSDSIFLQVKEGGALEALGEQSISKLVGGSSSLIQNVLGDMAIADLISDSGAVDFDGVLNSVKVGSLLSCIRRKIDVENISECDVVVSGKVWSTTIDENTLFLVQDDDGYYQAELTCTKDDCTHTADCYGYVWYNSLELGSSHEHKSDEFVDSDNKHHARVSGLYKAFVNLGISDIINGSADKILEKLKDVTLGDVVGGEISGILANFKDSTIGELMNGEFDGVYLGGLLGLYRKEIDTTDFTAIFDSVRQNGTAIAKLDDDKWYEAVYNCNEDDASHTCTADCYDFAWYKSETLDEKSEGIYKALANLKLSDLTSGSMDTILEKLKGLTLGDVVGEDASGILASLTDLTIGDLMNGEFDNLYLGTLLGCDRNEIEDISDYAEITLADGTTILKKTVDDQDIFAEADGDKHYEKALYCNEDHEHSTDCYDFVWYNEDDAGTKTPIDGLYKALVNLKLSEITNGSADAILEKMRDVKLSDVVGGELSGILANFADMTIGELIDGDFDSKYLGSLLGFLRKEIDVDNDGYTSTIEGIQQKGAAFAKLDDGKWYEAVCNCTDASHTCTADCYDFVWYNSEVLDGSHACDSANELDDSDGHHSKVDGLYKALVNLRLSDMTDGTDAIMEKLKIVTLGDIIGESAGGLLANFADMTIGEMIDGGFEELYLGNILGYLRREIDVESDGYTSTIEGIQQNGAAFAKLDDEKWYEAVFNCNNDDASHICTADCYDFVWYNSEVLDNSHACDSANELADDDGHHAKVDGLYKAFVNLRLSDMTDGDTDSIIDGLKNVKLSEIIGGDVEDGVLASFADMTIGEMMDGKIDNMYLGSLLSCIRKPIAVDDISDSKYTIVITGEEEGEKVWSVDIGGETVLFGVDDGKYYEKTIYCTNSDITHTHDADCYGFVWYNSLELGADHDCKTTEYIDENGNHHARVGGLYKAMVNLRLAEMMGGSSDVILNELKNVTLRDLVDGEIDGIMANFADMSVRELINGGIDGLYLGDFFNYKRLDCAAPETFDTLVDGESEFYVGQNGDQYVMSDDGTKWYKAYLLCEETHEHSRNCYAYIWMDGTTEASGLMAKLSENKIEDLGNLHETILTYTLGDVMGDNLSGLLLELKDTPINQISDKVYDLYLGSAIGYYRKSVAADYTDGTNSAKSNDDTTWYEAELDCTNTDATHTTHTADCYAYVWYTDEACTTKVSGIQKAFVNTKLNNIDSTIDSLTLNKLGIGGNTMLDALGDTPLNQISDELNNMKLGTMFGFVPQTVTDDKGTRTVWYEKCVDCTHADGEHVTLEGEDGYFTQAKGINAKMSDMTITDLTNGDGMTKIVTGFTLREMQESGIVSFDEEQEYKLDIIFDSSKECSLFEYLGASNTLGLDAKTYYKNKHGDDETYRGSWKEMTVTNFINTMLSII